LVAPETWVGVFCGWGKKRGVTWGVLGKGRDSGCYVGGRSGRLNGRGSRACRVPGVVSEKKPAALEAGDCKEPFLMIDGVPKAYTPNRNGAEGEI